MNQIPDLFSVLAPNACRAYILMQTRANERATRTRDYLECLWRTYYAYAEPQFLAEFPIHTHERWFEMFLTVTLLRRGADVIKTSPPGPDIAVNVRSRRIWIEAVCATGGEPGRADTISEPLPGDAFTVPWDAIALRIRNAVEEKKRKYQRYLDEDIVCAQDGLLIALNVHRIPYASSDVERYIFRSMFGVGNQVLRVDLSTARVVGSSNEVLQSVAKRSSRAPVGVQPFIDGSMGHVSGLIVSSFSAIAHAHRDAPDLTLYPNLTAETPWIQGLLPIDREWTFETSEAEWIGRLHDLSNQMPKPANRHIFTVVCRALAGCLATMFAVAAAVYWLTLTGIEQARAITYLVALAAFVVCPRTNYKKRSVRIGICVLASAAVIADVPSLRDLLTANKPGGNAAIFGQCLVLLVLVSMFLEAYSWRNTVRAHNSC
jgi:hypothetical protein